MIPKKRFPPPKKWKCDFLFKSSNATHFMQTKTLLSGKEIKVLVFWTNHFALQPNRIARLQNVSPMVQSASTDGPPLPPFPSQGNKGKLPYARTAPMQEEENTLTAHNIVSPRLTVDGRVYLYAPYTRWMNILRTAMQGQGPFDFTC